MNQLILKGVSKAFGSIQALSNVSISVDGGEIMALLGGNGSGKSTLAKVIAGTYRKDAGEVYLDGTRIESASPMDTKRAGIAMTSQELSLLDNFNVARNVCMCDLPRKQGMVDIARLTQKAREALALCGIEELWDRDVRSLSANQKYMVEMAKAIAQRPRVLILDEITSALYRKDVDIVKGLLRNLKKEGCAIILITHRMNEIFDMCDSVTVLRNGEFIAKTATGDTDEQALLLAMTGHDVTQAVFAQTGDEAYEAYRRENARIRLEKHALEGFHTSLDFDIARGEVVCVAGLQGQGQSQLVREMYACQRSVRMTLDGKPVLIHSPKDAVRKGFAFISGDREKEGAFGNRSILENVTAVSDLVLKRKAGVGALEGYGVKMAGPKQLIRALSGGNQQKIVLARWTSAAPEVLLADDPTKGIDVNARMDVHRIISSLADQGMSVVYASSDEDELVNLSRICRHSRVIVMYGGRIVHTLLGEERTKENIYLYAIPQGGNAL